MTNYKHYNNTDLIKELKYYINKGYIDKALIPELEKRLLEEEKKSELLELKNREIKLLKARLIYNDNDECQDVLFFENSNALEDVRDKIKALEEK